MTAVDLNKKIDELAQKELIPKGFKKSGIHYYKIENNQFYGLIKNTFRGSFEDYYLVYSHKCTGAIHNELLKKVSSMLKDYPVSIKVSDLKIIYNTEKKLKDSPYYFYYLAREFDIDPKGNESKEVWAESFTKKNNRNKLLVENEAFINNYADEIFKYINDFGFKFFEECDLELCYYSIRKPLIDKKRKQYIEYYKEFMVNIESYMLSKKIPFFENSNSKFNWLTKLFK